MSIPVEPVADPILSVVVRRWTTVDRWNDGRSFETTWAQYASGVVVTEQVRAIGSNAKFPQQNRELFA